MADTNPHSSIFTLAKFLYLSLKNSVFNRNSIFRFLVDKPCNTRLGLVSNVTNIGKLDIYKFPKCQGFKEKSFTSLHKRLKKNNERLLRTSTGRKRICEKDTKRTIGLRRRKKKCCRRRTSCGEWRKQRLKGSRRSSINKRTRKTALAGNSTRS